MPHLCWRALAGNPCHPAGDEAVHESAPDVDLSMDVVYTGAGYDVFSKGDWVDGQENSGGEGVGSASSSRRLVAAAVPQDRAAIFKEQGGAKEDREESRKAVGTAQERSPRGRGRGGAADAGTDYDKA